MILMLSFSFIPYHSSICVFFIIVNPMGSSRRSTQISMDEKRIDNEEYTTYTKETTNEEKKQIKKIDKDIYSILRFAFFSVS